MPVRTYQFKASGCDDIVAAAHERIRSTTRRGKRVLKNAAGLYLARVERIGDGFCFEQTCFFSSKQSEAARYDDRGVARFARANLCHNELRIVRLRTRRPARGGRG